MPTLLLDLDGVVYGKDGVIPGAAQTVKWLRDTDLHTARGGVWLADRVEGPLALFVPEATQAEFAQLPILDGEAEKGAGAVVVGDLGYDWSFAVLNRAFRLLIADPDCPLVALGMTRYWRAPDGMRLDVAPFVTALQHAMGRTIRVLGKGQG